MEKIKQTRDYNPVTRAMMSLRHVLVLGRLFCHQWPFRRHSQLAKPPGSAPDPASRQMLLSQG